MLVWLSKQTFEIAKTESPNPGFRFTSNPERHVNRLYAIASRPSTVGVCCSFSEMTMCISVRNCCSTVFVAPPQVANRMEVALSLATYFNRIFILFQQSVWAWAR